MFSVAGQQVRQGEYQGFVTLNGQLDYEQKRSYTMTILAVVSKMFHSVENVPLAAHRSGHNDK